MKTFKYIREEAEKATKADKIRNRRDASRRMRIRARARWFRRAIKRAMLKPASPDALDNRSSRKLKKVMQKKYQGQDAPAKYKNFSFSQRQNKDDNLKKRTAGKDAALDMAKKKLEIQSKKDARERAKRLREIEREKRTAGKK